MKKHKRKVNDAKRKVVIEGEPRFLSAIPYAYIPGASPESIINLACLNPMPGDRVRVTLELLK